MSGSAIRIAIIGGGLAGASLGNALAGHKLLEAHVFESAPDFSERGAGINLSSTCQQALGLVTREASQLLKRAGAVPQKSSRNMVGSGPHAGELVFDLVTGSANPGLNVHRASLLRELLAPLSPDVLHTSKRLQELTLLEPDGKVQVTFEDGAVSVFDAVIGADGIFGSVRKHVLRDYPEAWQPTAAGFWDCRNVLPLERVKDALGAEYFAEDRQYGWTGDGSFVLHDALEDKTMVQFAVVCADKGTDAHVNQKRSLTKEYLEKILNCWKEGPLGNAVVDLVMEQPNPQGYPEWEFRSTPTYANGRICIAGDAAHAMTPWQGAGGGQAFEDAAILGVLLGKITKANEIPAAFKAYDAVRRPRAQRIIDSSRETGLIMTGQDADAGLDPEKLRSVLPSRWNFIYGIDFEAYKQEALDKFSEFNQ